MAASCARRSLAAATICMALVILRVAFTEPMRVRSSFRLGIETSLGPCSSLPPFPACGEGSRRETLGELVEHADQLLLGIGGDFLLRGNVGEDVGMLLAH